MKEWIYKWLKVFGLFFTGMWLYVLILLAFPEIEEHLVHPWLFIPAVLFAFGVAIGLFYIIWSVILIYRILRELSSPDSTLNDADNDGNTEIM